MMAQRKKRGLLHTLSHKNIRQLQFAAQSRACIIRGTGPRSARALTTWAAGGCLRLAEVLKLSW
jgi:hypothetical protein